MATTPLFNVRGLIKNPFTGTAKSVGTYQPGLPGIKKAPVDPNFNKPYWKPFGQRVQEGIGKFNAGAEKVMPYVSNIVNSLRKTPRPKAPRYTGAVAPAKVNYSAQTADAERSLRGMYLNADRNLDENTAAAVQAGSMAQGLRAKSQIAQQEANTNAMIGNEANQFNSRINLYNAGNYNQYQRDLVDSEIATQRNQSENLANATDKFIMSKNEKAKAELDGKKWTVFSQMFNNSGVSERLIDLLKKQGMNDPTNTQSFGNGGKLGGPGKPDPTKPLTRTMPAKTREVRVGNGNVFDNYVFNIQHRNNGMVPYFRSNGTKGALPETEFMNMLSENNFRDTGEVFNIGIPDPVMLERYRQPNKNVLYRPADIKRTFPDGGTLPVDATMSSPNPTKHNLDKVKMNEMLSYSLNAAEDPMGQENGRVLFEMADTAYGRGSAQNLINEIMLFRGDKNNRALAPEERIRRFYSTSKSAKDFNIADPVSLYRSSPNVSNRQQQLARMRMGGHYKKVF